MRKSHFTFMMISGVLLCSAISLNAAETAVTINVNASSFIRTIPETMFGGNLTAWDGAQSGGNSTFNNLLIASGRKYQRWPGGSWGDAYLWSDMEGPGGSQTWIVSYSETLNLLNNILSQPGEVVPPTLQPIVNFPGYWYNADHSDAEAIAAAVAWVQDQSGRTPTAQYWEIGNEVYGPWEAGYFEGMRGSYYGDKFADFYIAMKAANPTIKIGAVAQEWDSPDWWNPGLWTRELLTAAYAKGVVPDFLIIHQYPLEGQSAGFNPMLLGARVNDIASFTLSLNTIVSSAIGPQHVGKIKYWMTEWDSGVVDGSYDRRQCYINAMFHAQYIMEMAKNHWEGSNAWAQWEYGSGFFVYPVWYVHPLLINRFGRDMFESVSNSMQVRGYAARDNDNNLTLFIANNNAATDANITVNISGFTAGTNGQQWLVTPAGTMIAGGANIQDYCDVNINGIIHPNPLTLDTISPYSFTSGSTFNLFVPMSGMTILKIPNAGDTSPPAAPTGLAATGSVGQISLNWDNNGDADLAGYNVYRSLVSGGYTKINSTLVGSSDYSDSNVCGGITYYYVVTAVDTSFNESDYSGQASAAPPDTTPPLAPSGLTATGGDSMVSLNWNDNIEGDVDGYNVYRSTSSGGPYGKLNGPLVTGSDYVDNTVENETTYYYVVTAVDTSSNESGYSNEASAMPNTVLETIYNFAGINAANTNYNAYACDVDQFPFAGVADNRNTMVEASDGQYINISADDAADWTTVDPQTGDEILLWVEMKLNEYPGNISKIDLTFDGYTNGGATTHRIFVLTAGANWTLDSSWTQVGTDQSISSGTYATMTRSITSNFSNYIDSNGKITWAVYETRSSESMRVNYLETKVYSLLDIFFPAEPTGLTALGGLGMVVLDWDDNGEPDLAGYNVYRMPEGGSYEKLNSSLITVSNYTDTDVTPGVTYYYVVTAVDMAMNESDASNEVSAEPASIASGTGAILCQWWNGIPGETVGDLTSDPNYPDNPSGEELLITLEGPVNWADYYGTRIRGYLNPLTTGSYTFWIASDNHSELWLSTDDNPANASRIANVPGYTPARYWTKYPEQRSSPVTLTAGQKYYIEVLHKDGDGGDNLAVAWEGPLLTQQIIDGVYLSPCCLDFENFAGFAEQWQQTGCGTGNDWCFGFDFDRDSFVSIDDLKAFADAWLAGAE